MLDETLVTYFVGKLSPIIFLAMEFSFFQTKMLFTDEKYYISQCEYCVPKPKSSHSGELMMTFLWV